MRGFDLETDVIILLIQIAIAVVFIFYIALREHIKSFGHGPGRGMLEIILLISFVEKNLDKSFTDQWFNPLGSRFENRYKPLLYERLQALKQAYRTHKDKGILSKAEYSSLGEVYSQRFIDVLIEMFILIVFAPITALFWFLHMREKIKGFSTVMLVHPNERAQKLMQTIGLIIILALWSITCLYWLRGKLAIIVLVFIGIGELLTIYSALNIILCQSEWKKLWAEKLLLVLQNAASTNDHDSYNRTLNLYNITKAYPAVPLTEVQRTILFLFAVVQFLVKQGVPVIKRVLESIH